MKKTDDDGVKRAGIYHIADDMGGGAVFCDGCHKNLGGNPRKIPEKCPKCGAVLSGSEKIYMPQGGSDF